MTKNQIHKVLALLISLVWLVNGLFCKLLNLVPRHQQIVACILGNNHASVLTKIIGCLEIGMAVWVVSGIKSRWCTLVQISLVATMNCIEFIKAPNLLLFGRINSLIAMFFILVLLYNEFILNYKTSKPNFTP